VSLVVPVRFSAPPETTYAPFRVLSILHPLIPCTGSNLSIMGKVEELPDDFDENLNINDAPSSAGTTSLEEMYERRLNTSVQMLRMPVWSLLARYELDAERYV
jgi:hypothetical protein